MKYIIMSVKSTTESKGDINLELPFLFPEACIHAEVAKHMRMVLQLEYSGVTVRPIAAGFFSCRDLQIKCHGKSESLDLPSRNEIDTDLIQGIDYGSMHV